MNDKIIGIIGGMGPDATANLYKKIINKTKVAKDQDHFRVIIDSNAKIPDRTEAIVNSGESPLPELIHTAKNLEKCLVDVACIPCITAHYFFDKINDSVDYKILNAIEELNKYIKNNDLKVENIGILSTSGTIKSKIFEKYFKDFNLIFPNENIQKNYVMESIYGENGIKNGYKNNVNREKLCLAGESLIGRGADLLIAGCTEIGLVLNSTDFSVPLLDPIDVLVDILVNEKVK